MAAIVDNVTAVLGGERNDRGGQSRSSSRIVGILRVWIDAAKNPTRKALGDTMLGNDMIHTGTAAGGAYQFPEAASLRISFSSVNQRPHDAMPVLSLRLLEPLTCLPFRPPYSER